MNTSEAMVTARMAVDKKEEGNRVLASLGTNASRVVNQLFDFVIEEHALPFEHVPERPVHSKAEIDAAIALVDGLALPVSDAYRDMSLKEARLARLGVSIGEDEVPR